MKAKRSSGSSIARKRSPTRWSSSTPARPTTPSPKPRRWAPRSIISAGSTISPRPAITRSPNAPSDWIIWLDGDDVISPDNQKRILDLKQTVLNDELEAVYLRYVYPPFRQWRERIARRVLFVEGKLKWKEPIHEFIDGIDGRKARYFDDIFIQHDTPPDRHRVKKDRNISILRKHVNKRGDRRSQPLYLRDRMSAQSPERRRRAGSRQVLFAGQDSRISLRDLQQDV